MTLINSLTNAFKSNKNKKDKKFGKEKKIANVFSSDVVWKWLP